MGRPTLVSLAKELGVSRQTVSNVINAPELVKPETRERVQAAIEASGYRPNRAAQSLRSQRSLVLAMRIYPSSDGIYGAVMDRFLHSLVGQAHKLGYQVMPITAVDDRDELAQLCQLHERGSIDGCLLSGTDPGDVRPRELVRRAIPVATFGRPRGADDANHFWVDVDGAGAMGAATRALAGKGHQRIGFVGLRPGSGSGNDRREGWAAALRERFPEIDVASLDTANDDSIEAGMGAVEELLEHGATAFVCATDSLAFGVLARLRQAHPKLVLNTPVVGFDDSPVARAVGLSSVAQPVDEAVRLLLDAMLAHLRDREAPWPPPVMLDAELVLRAPTAMA